ncbi:hypothetical protein E2C01_084823 [Portunus trituberculatus]|uniref:Uncharacterized protein n=1 Tax=Portunus trituberculatus TaxID=210409 RepID=A0A5B7IWC5_PORTR|nr:hypothetical protein [Portunus trituberculatus]
MMRGALGSGSRSETSYRAAWIRQRAASRIPLSGKSSATPPRVQVLGSGFGYHGSARPSNRIREYIKSRILPSSTLRHYIMECPLIAKFRPQGQHDLYSLIVHLLDSATLRDILREYPQFAPKL